MKLFKSTPLIILLSIGLMFYSLSINAVTAAQTSSFTPNWNPNNMIDNPTLLNDQTMSEAAIQGFLTNIGSGLANYSDVEACDAAIAPYYPHCGQTEPAAQLIYDASQAYNINPRAILADLEKEQSLVTDPSPTSSQLNCAMGYNSCNGYVGFFTQVDNGTWQLRLDEMLSSGQSWWGYSPSQYPCENADTSDNPQLYSNGILPGNTVTFYDPGGTPETVTIANAATATLYCYTPYVGPASVTGYSGSYNFVYYFQLWFGSTQASIPYSWIVQSQSSYSNSALTDPFTNTSVSTVAPGQDVYMQIQARNVGYDSWQQGSVDLITSNPNNSSDPFYSSSWISSTSPATLTTSTVAPGDVGTFNFTMQAPSQTGTYYEYFNLSNGGSALNNPGLYYQINVVAPATASSTTTILSPGQSLSIGNYLLSPDQQSALDFQSNGNIALYNNFQQTWQTNTANSGGDILYMQGDGNLVEYNSVGTAVWNSGTQGNSGAYLALQTDGNLVIYSSSGIALWATYTQQNPNHLDYVNTTASEGSILFGGQELQTATRNYSLIMQGDGNLVEYNSVGTAVWNSGTQGNPGAWMALQGDGNLVIYSPSGKALWASYIFGSNNTLDLQSNGQITINTGSGSILLNNQVMKPGQEIQSPNLQYSLIMQGDGNLVEYNSVGTAVWNSGTENNPGAFMAMQGDGNLVIYSPSGKALWASYIFGSNNTIKLSDTGQLTIDPSSTVLLPGQELMSGQEIETANHQLTLIMQGDGNLVEYNSVGTAVWNSGTENNPGAFMAMQGDGNLVIYGPGGNPLWASLTQGNPGAYLALQTDGNLVIYSHVSNNPLWATYHFL